MRRDQRSAAAEQYHAWYRTAAWQAIRRDQLQREPLCRMCGRQGRVTAATVCDHVQPHRGDRARFFGGPFQSLCKTHHDGAKQSEERTGKVRGCDAEGWPLDRGHHWKG